LNVGLRLKATQVINCLQRLITDNGSLVTFTDHSKSGSRRGSRTRSWWWAGPWRRCRPWSGSRRGCSSRSGRWSGRVDHRCRRTRRRRNARCCGRRRRRARCTCWTYGPSASRRTTRAVTEILSKAAVVSLYPGGGRCVAVGYCAVDHVKATLPLVQPQLEVGTARSRKVLCSPLDVEDAVGCTATYRGEYAESTIDQIQVVPVRVDRVVVAGPWQALVGEGCIRGNELSIAVGRQIDASKGLIIQGEREGERDGGYRVIPVIAYVGRTWHDAAGYLLYAAARPRRWSRGGRERRRWAGGRCWRWGRQRNIPSCLHYNSRRRACLKVAYRRVR
jgi:hypothetical protein